MVKSMEKENTLFLMEVCLKDFMIIILNQVEELKIVMELYFMKDNF
jgi:hypothetical protein